mmetsp:Transcript_28002/g.91560  ORF Transcript_28002/g.91560 Transcript_28002/m.91560 type:complete len:116 (-) Transcript_28002:199-546(-)
MVPRQVRLRVHVRAGDPCCFYGKGRHARIEAYDAAVNTALAEVEGGTFGTAVSDWNVHAVCEMDRAIIAAALRRIDAAHTRGEQPSFDELPCNLLNRGGSAECPFPHPRQVGARR